MRGSGEGPAPRRISYITNQTRADVCRAGGCEWRVYDPGTGGDDLFLKLHDSPTVMFWDSSFRQVYFGIKDTVYRVVWQRGATPQAILTLPPLEHGRGWPWLDTESGSWRYYDLLFHAEGREGVEEQDLVRVWEQSEIAPGWKLLASLKTDCGCDNCPCTSVVEPYRHRRAAVLPASHRVWDKDLAVELEGSDDDERRTVYVLSQAEPRRALKLATVFYAEANTEEPPVHYVNREIGSETLVYDDTERDRPYDDRCHGNLDFSEQGRYMLIQRLGGCPKLIDMRTGEVLFSPAFHTGQAAWVEPLQP